MSQSVISKNICNLDFYLNGCSSHEEIKVCAFFINFIQNDDQTNKIHNEHKSDDELDSYFNKLNFSNSNLLPVKKVSHEKNYNQDKKLSREKKVSRDSSN